ncbi:MAG: bifunctional tetrahydrofolate synthase/dihydrofolate synthase [Steroidobacterales bacterium]
MAPSSLDEWLAFQSQLHPRAIDLGLTRLQAVLERLHWRRPAASVITIAGTNGKGSVAAMCGAILASSDLRVGVFTSPHFRDYRERIRIEGRMVENAALTASFERIEAARGEIALTFFEYNTLAALLLFDAANLDAWVLEVGLGGRLDAVNVIDPDVAVVVSIGLDHQDYLGATLDQIGREKAGIFRRDKPALLGSRTLPGSVAATAVAVGARLKRLGVEYDYSRAGAAWHYRGTRWDLPGLPPPALFGDKQYDNAATAIAAVEELASLQSVTAASIAAGLRSAQLTGRFQVIRPAAGSGPVWILDVAHNPDAARVLAGNLRALPAPARTLAVCGILADKDAAAIVAELRGCFDHWWFVATAGDRGRSASALASCVAVRLDAPADTADSLPEACAAAAAQARDADRIVIFGSFHTVGPALDWLESHGVL